MLLPSKYWILPPPQYTKNITFIWQYTSTVPSKKAIEILTCAKIPSFFIVVFKFQQDYRAEKYFARPGGLTERPEGKANTRRAAGHSSAVRQGNRAEPSDQKAQMVGGAESWGDDKDIASPSFITKSYSS